MNKYIMMIGLISLIGVNYGEASDVTTPPLSDSLITNDSGKNFQENEEIIKEESSSNSLTTTRSSSDDLMDSDEKEITVIDSSLDDSSAADPFDIDEEKINEFVVEKVISHWNPNKKELEISDEIFEAFQLLMKELNAEDKVDRIRAYIDNQAFHPSSLIAKGLKDADDVASFLEALEQCV